MKRIVQTLIYLFVEPTKNIRLQTIRYVFVGIAATIIDWAVFYALIFVGISKYISAFFSFCTALTVNFILSKQLLFKMETSRIGTGWKEFAGHAIIGVVGLGLTELIIFILTEKAAMNLLVSKVAATAITMIWNFLGRKFIIYKPQ